MALAFKDPYLRGVIPWKNRYGHPTASNPSMSVSWAVSYIHYTILLANHERSRDVGREL